MRSPPSRAGLLLAEAVEALRAGRFSRAAELTDEALQLEPNNPDGLHLGGIVALQLGRLPIAVERLRRANARSPANPALLGDYGLALHRAGRLADAEATLRRALKLQPAYPEALVNLGNVLGDLGRDDEALLCYNRAIALRPDFSEAHSNLALLDLRLGLPLEAVAAARRALALRPDMPEGLQSLGHALNAAGRFDEALIVQQRAIALWPRDGECHFDLGQTQMHYGRLADAATSFRTALALEPRHGDWHRLLSSIVRHKGRDAEIEAMQQLYAAANTSTNDRLNLGFGLGKALEDIGEHDESFGYFLEANRLKRATFRYASAESDKTFADIEASFTADYFAGDRPQGSPDPAPVFVLGMPRSGTSLVEQVLASHPDVVGAGEFVLLNRLVGGLNQATGPFRFANVLNGLDSANLAGLANAYLAHIRQLAPDARFVVDKTPGNFMLIGMIHLAFPNAKIVHCTRDAVDNSLSVFKTYFSAEGLRYAYDLAEIGHYHNLYLHLMDHWHAVLPGVVHDVSYETMVADFDGEARKLYDFVGLDWRDEAREFFNTARPVQTASAAQVRQPIYKTSVGQRARYGDRIAPLLKALEA